MPAGKDTMKEIAEQFDCWRAVLEDIDLLEKDVDTTFKVKEYDEVIFTGAGTSYHLAVSAASSFRKIAGHAARAVAASEIVFFHQYHLKRERKYLVVYFSRSGLTTETLAALETMGSFYRSHSIAITCDPASKLAQSVDVSFPVKNCVEKSIIMTKSFTSMLIISLMFSAAYGEKLSYMTHLEHLPEEGQAAFELQRRAVDATLKDGAPERVTFLGGGPFLGLTSEAALKLDEMSLSRSQAFTPLELRHGPKAGICPDDLIVLLMSNSGRVPELKLLAELKLLGVRSLVLTDQRDRDFDHLADNFVATGRGISEDIRGVLYMPFLQYFGCRAALIKGVDPDQPRNLTRVVQI